MPDQTRLLVVDDDADIRELLSAYLARYDMTVETAADGAGLFEKLDHAHFDLIILDIMLPGMDGIGLCKELRIRGNETPILFLSARDSVRTGSRDSQTVRTTISSNRFHLPNWNCASAPFYDVSDVQPPIFCKSPTSP